MKNYRVLTRRWSAMLAITLVICGGTLFAQVKPPQGYRPAKGFVPDEATAKAIAEAVLSPIYGNALVAKEKPLYAHLEKGVWQIQGTPITARRMSPEVQSSYGSRKWTDAYCTSHIQDKIVGEEGLVPPLTCTRTEDRRSC